MKEIIILALSISMVSIFASTANAMRSLLTATETSEAALVDSKDEADLIPIIADQPPEDEEHWPGSRD